METTNSTNIDEEREAKLQQAANDAYLKLGVDTISLAFIDQIGLLASDRSKTQEFRDGYSAAILDVYRAIANARYLARLKQSERK